MSVKNRQITSLVRGLVTEASELTYPEGSTVDELNATIERDGSRRRRLGLDYEKGHQFLGIPEAGLTSLHLWRNAGNIAGKTIVVAQFGSIVRFYDVTAGQPLSSGLFSYSLDLSAYLAPTATTITSKIDTTVARGSLVVVEKNINPILVNFDGTNFSDQEIVVNVRDFVWLGDKSQYTDPGPNPPSNQRLYDTYNSGWTTDPYNIYVTDRNASPPLTHPWFSGKNAAGNFDTATWEQIYAGTSIITNGRFVVNLWNRDRATASGIADPTLNTTEDSRFSVVETYAGRVFYSGINDSTDNNGSKIFFSRLIVDDTSDIGNLYQANDPTSEEISDLLDTDGGFISIPEAHNITGLYAIGPYLIVFATNGVWSISGIDDVFRPTDFVVSKITNVGLEYPDSLVASDSRPYWWSQYGIHTIDTDKTGALQELNISINTIQTLWLQIPNKETVSAAFDAVNKKIYWLYGEDHTKKNDLLIFDEVLQAYHRFKVSDKKELFTPVVSDLIFIRDAIIPADQIVVSTIDNQNITNGADNVIVEDNNLSKFKPELFLLTYEGGSGYSFSSFHDTNLYDWGDTEYKTYLETMHDFLDTMSLKKRIIYLDSFFKRTERGWQKNEYGSFSLVSPSSCFVSALWDFSDKPVSRQQAYRLPPTTVPYPQLDLEFDKTVVRSRLRLRGSGQSMRLRWESEGNKDFHLLGWSLIANDKTVL